MTPDQPEAQPETAALQARLAALMETADAQGGLVLSGADISEMYTLVLSECADRVSAARAEGAAEGAARYREAAIKAAEALLAEVEPWASGPVWAKHRGMFIRALDATTAEAREPGISVERPCPGCHGRRWADDENWQPSYPESWDGTREPGDGLIPCGFCNEGGWDTPLGARLATEPTDVVSHD